jgi:hypothetical protein
MNLTIQYALQWFHYLVVETSMADMPDMAQTNMTQTHMGGVVPMAVDCGV